MAFTCEQASIDQNDKVKPVSSATFNDHFNFTIVSYYRSGHKSGFDVWDRSYRLFRHIASEIQILLAHQKISWHLSNRDQSD